MNATAVSISGTRSGVASDAITGFGNFLAKEVREWLRARRFMTMTLVATALALSGVLIERIRQIAGDTSAPINLDPTYNLHMAGWDSLVPLIAAFGTFGLIVAERERGTLAWSLSMPLARPAVLFAKFLAAVVFVAVTVVIVPELVSIAAIRLAYGGFPAEPVELFWEPLGGFAIAVFVIALNLAVSMFVKAQAAVIGATLVTTLTIATIVGTISKDLARFMPTEIFAYLAAYGEGSDTHLETLVAWAVAVVALLTVALVRFRTREL